MLNPVEIFYVVISLVIYIRIRYDEFPYNAFSSFNTYMISLVLTNIKLKRHKILQHKRVVHVSWDEATLNFQVAFWLHYPLRGSSKFVSYKIY